MEEVLNDILEELRKLNLQNKKILTQEEAAEYLNTHTHKISELRKTGLLKSIKIGANYNYLVEELDRFLKEYQGYDLSNRKSMVLAVTEKTAKKHQILED